jgi:hypothetical protein
MSKEKNLFELLKPEAKRNLVRNIIKYPESVNSLISRLKHLYLKSQLTVDDVSGLHLFTGTDWPDNPIDAIYCNDIFDAYDR